jgi:tetratricopeptide (TPR) repeat protein
MNSQLDFFTPAIDHLQNAYDAIENTDFELAKREATIAREIDPYIPTLNTTAKIIALLETHYRPGAEPGIFVAGIWQLIPQACRSGKLNLNEAHLADRYLARIAERQLGQGCTFIDAGEILHWGCCYLLSNKYERARKTLLDTLSSTHPLRADLWAYYGDVCMESKHETEALSAYLNAVVINPQAIDLFRIKNKEISGLFMSLQNRHSEAEARALLLFHGWLGGIFKIPKFFGQFLDGHAVFQAMFDGDIPQDRVSRIHRFSLCLCRDQSQSNGGSRDYRYRELMLDLNNELFEQYMKKLRE